MGLKIISWNVNSIRKGILDELSSLIIKEDPDIICFQETKTTESDAYEYFKSVDESVIELLKKYPFKYWNNSVKGQAGVSTWCKKEPINTYNEIPQLFQTKLGRIIVSEFEDMILLNTYVPNTGRGTLAEQERCVWHNSLIEWLPDIINSDKLFIWCGDLNVVDQPKLDTSHHEIRPKTPGAGLKQFEKNQFDDYISLGLTDVYRYMNPDTVSFTWFSNFRTDVGWRLDYFLVNNIEKINNIIHNKRLPKSVSDHTWILLDLK
jgi:exodeoxyribonuclease III